MKSIYINLRIESIFEAKTIVATYKNDCLKLADVVIVDIQYDYIKKSSEASEVAEWR